MVKEEHYIGKTVLLVELIFILQNMLTRNFAVTNVLGRTKKATIATIKCNYCNKHFNRYISCLGSPKSGLRFCSRNCKDLAQRIGDHNSLLRPSHYNDGRYNYREIAFRTYDPCCNRCKFNEYVSVLQVHHKDRDRTNNCSENLEILCPTCHDIEHFLAKDGPYGKKKRACGVVGNT